MEGVDLASTKDLNKDNGTNQLHIQEAEHLPPLVVPPSAPPVQLGHFQPRHPADFRGEGWKKDVHLAYLFHIAVTIDVTAEEADALTAPVTRHME